MPKRNFKPHVMSAPNLNELTYNTVYVMQIFAEFCCKRFSA